MGYRVGFRALGSIFEDIRLGQIFSDFVGDFFGFPERFARIAPQLIDEGDEFISAKARRRVDLADGVLQAVSGIDEERVAHVVAMQVIEGLEVVQVDEHDRAVLFAGRGGVDGERELVDEEAPVGQLGQRVVGGLPEHFVALALGFADVLHDPDGSASGIAVDDALGQEVDPKFAAILAAHAMLAVKVAALPEHGPHAVDEVGVKLVGDMDEARGLPKHVLFGIAEHFAGESANQIKDAVFGDDDSDKGIVQNSMELALLLGSEALSFRQGASQVGSGPQPRFVWLSFGRRGVFRHVG